ncbi:MAG TPA: hypothetical protein VG937_37165 [Polyangiaceae bacterium]|nr:hypothetical protein [Polyangiaceae bacterium]
MRTPVLPVASLVALLSFAMPALAQFTRDPAATAKIDEAIKTHYLAGDFLKAEAVLTGTIKACETRCSPKLLARAWMYVGVVRGGRSDQPGAKEAFINALAIDGTVQLDAGVATVETQATFVLAGGAEAPASPEPSAGPPVAESPAPTQPNTTTAVPKATAVVQGDGVVCTPAVKEVETRRPIPVECTPDEETTRAELRYKAFGAETWQTLTMERKGKAFRAQIPCDATQNIGLLKFYVQGEDAEGVTVVNWGSKKQPVEIALVDKSALEPPSYDDSDAPARCPAPEICPPDFPGCADKTAGEPKLDSAAAAVAPYRKWWFGLHVAHDIAFAGSDNACMPGTEDENLVCYRSGSREDTYDTTFFETERGGTISFGAVSATTRILLSADYAFTPNVTAGLRLGYALGGGPPAGRSVQYDADETVSAVTDPGLKFLPLHVEARFGYWFGENPLGKVGLRPYVHGGGGLAQVDAKIVAYVEDKNGVGKVDAWKKLGRAFFTLGGGVVYAFTPTLAAQANLNAMYLVSASGLVIEPSLGALLGF